MNVHNVLAIAITFFVAFILTLLPMPEWAIWLRPAWIMMVLVYWVILLPYRVNIGVAWFVGILQDLLNGTLFGEHALALIVVCYLAIKIHQQFRMYSLLQQSLWIGLFVLLYQIVIYGIQGFIGELPKTSLYWSSCLTSGILWPWVFVLLRDYRFRFKIA